MKNTHWAHLLRGVLCGLALATAATARADIVVDFEDLGLAPGSYHLKTPFTSQGTSFSGAATPWDSWYGWGYSNITNQTDANYLFQGGTGEVSAKTTTTPGNNTYGVTYDNGAAITLPDNYRPTAMSVTNTTLGYLTQRDGNGFSRAFSAGDYFKVTVTGSNGGTTTGTLDFYLADFRDSNSANHFILDEWETIDLTSLGAANQLSFAYTSTDVGDYGINTPTYFAMDNLTVAAVPEPSTLAMVGLVGLGGAWRTWRQRRRQQPLVA